MSLSPSDKKRLIDYIVNLPAEWYVKQDLPLELVEDIWGKPEKEKRTKPTPRQLEVISLCANGYTYEQISRRLNILRKAVLRHIGNICEILDVRSTEEAIETCRKRGWI